MTHMVLTYFTLASANLWDKREGKKGTADHCLGDATSTSAAQAGRDREPRPRRPMRDEVNVEGAASARVDYGAGVTDAAPSVMDPVQAVRPARPGTPPVAVHDVARSPGEHELWRGWGYASPWVAMRNETAAETRARRSVVLMRHILSYKRQSIY